jgi:DNA replication protein DnaC
MVSKAQVTALAAGDGWLGKGANLLLFGPPGGGKSHLAAAIGLALIENGWRVLFTRATDLVQKLQVARRELNLEVAVNRLDRFDLMILDDLAYVTKDQAETSVLFELISARYERRSMLITANQPFGEWNTVLPRPCDDPRRHRSPRSPRHRRRDECRELSQADCPRTKTRSRSPDIARDTQNRR